MHRIVVFALGIALIGCMGPNRVETVDGPFRLTFSLAKTTWSAGESIDGRAALSVADGGPTEISGSGGGVIHFGFREVGGVRQIGPAMTSDCAAHRLEPAMPIDVPIVKSGGWTAEDPDAAFYQAFFADPLVHLPPGDWEITAIASFIDGPGCSGDSRTLNAPITIRVVP